MEASVGVSPDGTLSEGTPGYHGADHPHGQSLAVTTQRKVSGESAKESMARHCMP